MRQLREDDVTAPAGVPAPASSTRSASFLVVPLIGVTSFAIFGQFATIYGFLNPADLGVLDDLASWGWLRLVLAIGAAAVFESMALFVQYQAHAMLLLKATSTAAKHRRISYGFAAGAALIQYWHFSDEWSPTPLAVMFAAFSAAGPWLWGLHTRHVKHLHLLREGQADSIGATFSAERWRAFPWRTWQARRWSIDFGVDDPREAWAGYKAEWAERAERRADLRAAQEAEKARAAAPPDPQSDPQANHLPDDDIETGDLGAATLHTVDGVDDIDPEGELPDRRPYANTADLRVVIDDLRAVSGRTGRRYSRDEIQRMYRIKSDRAMLARRVLAWADGPTRPDPEPTLADRETVGAPA